MGTAFTRRVFSKSPGREIDPMSWEGRVISRQHPVAELRQRLFVAGNTSPQSHVETLEELLRTRSELAQLVGRESWGDVALEDKMAKNPRDVMAFLDSLNEHNRPLASEDLALLRATKKQHTGSYTTPKIYAWDRDYYSDMSNQSRGGPPIPDISPFFSLGTCFQGLSRLFTSLYGIRFEVAPLSPGETWDPSVRKLRVIDEDEGTIGTIYCDLFARDGKANGAAHYTVRCSRRLDDDHIAGMDYGEDGMATVEGVKIAREELEGLEVIPVKWRGREGTFQEPIIVLVCAFGEEDASSPAGLQWGEVETLFHEMGHAIHCLLMFPSLL
jgi:intermediate peptidase